MVKDSGVRVMVEGDFSADPRLWSDLAWNPATGQGKISYISMIR